MWLDIVEKTDYKTAGKTAYNLALAYEVIGDLQIAKDWAQRAYTQYNVKKARDYSAILQRRIYEIERLKQQMIEK